MAPSQSIQSLNCVDCRSDVVGHIYTMIGRDWTHQGVAKLFTDITNNGYQLLYLTSRSVGQADTTRGYLKSIVQDKYTIPEGPVIMSPDRTFTALRRYTSDEFGANTGQRGYLTETRSV